tara:strand:+ start:2123 stop:2308 length:186 start_codon:yes stop_codon:yes gene_type:complete
MKYYRDVVYKKIKHYLSALKIKRTENNRFIVEVPTTMRNESDKNKLMADILDILEHQIKLH